MPCVVTELNIGGAPVFLFPDFLWLAFRTCLSTVYVAHAPRLAAYKEPRSRGAFMLKEPFKLRLPNRFGHAARPGHSVCSILLVSPNSPTIGDGYLRVV